MKWSSLVNADIHSAVTEALTAYENRDFLKIVSGLVPQIEAMLRELLKVLDIPMRKPIRVGAGSELKNMNDVLSDERIVEILDETSCSSFAPFHRQAGAEPAQ